MGFVDKFIEACYSNSRRETKKGKTYIRMVTPDSYSTFILDLSNWNPSEETLVDYIANNTLDWFKRVIGFYAEDADGNIVRKDASSTPSVDVDISIQDLLDKAKELGLE